MATNKKKIFVTESMSQQGRILLREREDIELIEFPNMISAKDFEAMLRLQAPVHGVALGATRFGEPELEASKDMKVVTRIGVGYDAVDIPALSRRKIPLMVAGTANSPSVAEQALFMMLTLAKRAVEMHPSSRTANGGIVWGCCRSTYLEKRCSSLASVASGRAPPNVASPWK
jgi:D-3-phosphoglycerate dehydrogenase / 2-oxoglutarate reductase